MDAKSLVLLYPATPERIDAIRAYSEHLRSALEETLPTEVRLDAWSPSGNPGAAGRRLTDYSAGDVLILQYNPFSYGRRGFAPRLIVQAIRLRLKRRRPMLVLMVHEPYVPLRGLRWTLMGIWQRLQLWSVALCADRVIVTVDAWRSKVRPSRGRAGLTQVPVGSNLPDRRSERGSARSGIGADDGSIVLAGFGTGDPARLVGHIVAAANGIARARTPVTLLNLGAGAPPLTGIDPAVRTITPGELAEAEVARLLAGADIFVAPYAGGVSTRRTTLMAALQHGLPVVGTFGSATDALLAGSRALVLSSEDEPDGFARATLGLALDSDSRRDRGHAARRLYDDHFSWPVIAADLIAALSLGKAPDREALD
jgi:glycosyltransferase involved in cell wall biosynthesis